MRRDQLLYLPDIRPLSQKRGEGMATDASWSCGSQGWRVGTPSTGHWGHGVRTSSSFLSWEMMLAASSIHAPFLFARRILVLSWEMCCLGGPGLQPQDLDRGSCGGPLLTATQGWGSLRPRSAWRAVGGARWGSPLLPPGAVVSEVMSRTMAAT